MHLYVYVVAIGRSVAGSRTTVILMLKVVTTNCNLRVGHLCLSLFYTGAAWRLCSCCVFFAVCRLCCQFY